MVAVGALLVLAAAIWAVVEGARPKRAPHRPIDDLDDADRALVRMADIPASIYAEYHTPDEVIEPSQWPIWLAAAGALPLLVAAVRDLLG